MGQRREKEKRNELGGFSHGAKTIFISSFQAHMSRNILSTDALTILQAREDVQIVILVPDYKRDYFERNFASPNTVIEGAPLYQASKTRAGLFFKRLGIFLFHTKTARAKRKYQYYCEGKYVYYAFGAAFGFLGRSFLVHSVVRALDYWFSPKNFFDDLFMRYAPDLVFATDVQNENDVALMHASRRWRVPLVGMVRSWDNPTQRTLRVFPDRLLVGSETLKEEAARIYRYPEARIGVTGNPHYDRYLKGPQESRKEFFRSFGLDPDKRLILYAPFGDMLIRHNDVDEYVMEILAGLGTQVLVRFPPDEKVHLPHFSKPSQMAYDIPGVGFKKNEFGDREISREDDQRLIDSLVYADVVISGPTSIPLDAALLDKPAIMAHLYPSPRGFCGSVYNFWFAHIEKFLATDGVAYATSKEELIGAITHFLENPEWHGRGRARIRAMWFSHADGHAGERLAEELLSFVNRVS